MAVHFKFRSAVGFDSIDIEGPFISIGALKEKIVEQKNLGRANNIDLVITHAQTSEEYTDDSFLLPKNTSVIIQLLPASRSKPILRVDEQPKKHVADVVPADKGKGADIMSQAPAFPKDGTDSLDDFGVDLYAIPESVPTSSRIDPDENTRISAMVNSTASDWQRQTQEGFAGGRGFGRGGYGRGGAARGAGRSFGRATPPQGYVCHRCGQPGHFIQHCPTNGDPTYDMRRMKPPVGIPKTRLKADQEGSYILPDGSVAVMQPDEMVFAKEADALLAIRPILLEPPPELKCPLCGNIFKDAVMIPCCQYSFCDKCIREELIAKGKCPQCESTKFKNDDLLPNINLRQAIDRFLEAQMTTSGASDSFYRQQQVPDVESVPQKGATPAASRLQIELRKPSSSAGVSAQPPPAKEVDVADSIAESSKSKKEKREEQAEGSAVVMVGGEDSGGAIEGPPSKEDVAESVGKEELGVSVREEEKPGFVNDEGETGKMPKNIEPPYVKDVEGVAVESEVSKGKKKKKRARPLPAGDTVADSTGGGKLRKMQGERVCYICGSPDHLARDCVDHGVPGPYGGPHPGMFGPGGPMPPMGMRPYGGGYNLDWHGRPMHGHAGPFGYGENMPGPGPAAIPYDMPYDRPMMMGPQYGVPPYGMPPMYPGAPIHSGFMGGGPGMMGPVDRPPLSREEFLEVQERQRQERRHRHQMLEQSEREWSQEGPYKWERDGNMRHQTPESEHHRLKETRERSVEYDERPRKQHDPDRDLGRDFSDDNKYKLRNGRAEPKRASERLVVDTRHHSRRRGSLSEEDDVVSGDDMKPSSRRLPRAAGGHHHDGKVAHGGRERESSRQRRGYSSEHDAHGLPGKNEVDGSQSRRGRRVESNSKYVPGSAEMESHYRGGGTTKRATATAAREDSLRHSNPPPEEVLDLRMKLGRKREKERHERQHGSEYELDEDMKGGGDHHSEKPKHRRHHSRSKSKGEQPTAVAASYDSEESKRKKRKHRKHYDDDGMVDRAPDSHHRGGGGSFGLDEPESAKPRKHKSKGSSHGGPPTSNSIEVTRWQLVDSELGEARSSHTHHSKSSKNLRSSHNG